MNPDLVVNSLQNPRVKDVVRYRKRTHRDRADRLIIEGYRELKRALDNDHRPDTLFYAQEFFQGGNEDAIVQRCREAEATLIECSAAVFQKIAYRDRPEGLLALAPQVHGTLVDLPVSDHPLVVVAEGIEKPGNLGSILRSADAAGVDGLIVVDECTDLNNPNTVRASIGTLFSVPVAEASGDETIAWLKKQSISVVAATPAAETVYSDTDMRGGTAIVVGTEQVGLSAAWTEAADVSVSIPMLGQADSLNVANAATILLFEAVRQRRAAEGSAE